MLIYYGLIVLSVVMFGGGFAIQDVCRKKRGSGLKISMEAACIGAFAGLIVLLAFNDFSFAVTPFTFWMAVLAALNGMAFTFCAFKALDYINLSLFSLFAMLGGMALPFFQGILFYEERFTLAKAVCVVFIFAALLCTVERGGKKKGTLFYVGIFVLNGMSGVLSKLFTAGDQPKNGAMEYSTWIALATVVLSGVAWLVLTFLERGDNGAALTNTPTMAKRSRLASYALGAVNGAINRVANLLLVFALIYVDSSVQYPMVTGGTIVVSTAISCLEGKKPSRRELLSVGLALVGVLSLFFIPML